jgi:hypothetical protein
MPIMIWLAVFVEAAIGNWLDMIILLLIQFVNASIGWCAEKCLLHRHSAGAPARAPACPGSPHRITFPRQASKGAGMGSDIMYYWLRTLPP